MITALSNVVALFTGAITAIVGIVLTVVIVRELTGANTTDWFDAKAQRRRRIGTGGDNTATV
ncbi:hypothetical protein [Nocardia sp. NPDC052112]|uniref:hypothetical protein n=1 Tax=Nocardia sp. NPDC052112 TaxID=3155646 RepID=UPI00341DED43